MCNATVQEEEHFRYVLTLSYIGTQYHGWQLQAQSILPTIQGVVENVLHSLYGERIPLIASSRTDAGVHALGQVAHYTVKKYISTQRLFAYFVHHLPNTISLRSVELVKNNFHSQYSLYKCYRYSLWASKAKPFPQLLPFVWHVPSFSLASLRRAVSQSIGTRNYAVFRNNLAYTHESSGKTLTTDNVRTVYAIYAEHDAQYEECIHCTFWGNGFLRGMVRNYMGFLLHVVRGKIAYADIEDILLYKERKLLISPTAPAHGLSLHHIGYPPYTVVEKSNSL